MLQEAILLWQDNHCIAPQNPCLPRTHAQVLLSLSHIRLQPIATQEVIKSQEERRRDLSQTIWDDCSVLHHLRIQLQRTAAQQYIYPDIDPLGTIENPIYLYIFSGRRRDQDFQYQVEYWLTQRKQQGRVLLLDLALSPRHDVYDVNLVSLLVQWMNNHIIAAVLIAPPCETWSEARHLEAPGQAPRPLRSTADPLLHPNLTKSELVQIQVSNFLLFVGLRILHLACLNGVGGVLEHPKEPRAVCRASIWRLPWMKGLMKLPNVRRELIWQAKFGAASAKPTHLISCNLVGFKRDLQQFEQPVCWQELVTLGGRADESTWRTASAKEYPVLLNRALAFTLVSHAEHAQLHPIAADVLHTVNQQYTYLDAGAQDYAGQTMQPDLAHIDRTRREDDIFNSF